MRQICYSPEAVVVANPSLITAEEPAALLALQRAYALGMRGDYDEMIAAASEAIRLEPDNPFGYLLRGSGYASRDLCYCRRDMEALQERLVEAGFPKDHITLMHTDADRNTPQLRPM